MRIEFVRYETIATGDVYYALAEDAVRKVIDNEEFIEVTTDINNINRQTVFMIKTDSLKRLGSSFREV